MLHQSYREEGVSALKIDTENVLIISPIKHTMKISDQESTNKCDKLHMY